MMLFQTDFLVEGNNLERFRYNFNKNKNIIFPKCIHSSQEVLIESFEFGTSLQNFLEYGITSYHSLLAKIGFESFAQMVLQDNYCHADCHAGNLYVTFEKNGEIISSSWIDKLNECNSQESWHDCIEQIHQQQYVPKIIVLDVGLVNSLSPSNMKNLRDTFRASLEGNGQKVATIFVERSKYPEQVLNVTEFRQKFEDMVNELHLDRKGQLLISNLFAIDIVQKFASLVRQHRITLDGDFSGLLVACMILEGIGRQLDADLDILPVISEYLFQ
jgi:aarF domain-containing kinase